MTPSEEATWEQDGKNGFVRRLLTEEERSQQRRENDYLWRLRHLDHNRQRQRICFAVRRAQKLARVVERVDPLVLYERDGGRCGICKERVAENEIGMDHIIPLSRGGDHIYRNMELVHQRCNSAKGVRAVGQQLRLVG